MKKHEKAQEKPGAMATNGQMKELCILGSQAMPAQLTHVQAEKLLGEKKGDLVRALSATVKAALELQYPRQMGVPLESLAELADWQKFYRDVFGVSAEVVWPIPWARDLAYELIVLFPGVSLLEIWRKCGEYFPCATAIQDIEFSASDVRSRRKAQLCGYGVRLIGHNIGWDGLDVLRKSLEPGEGPRTQDGARSGGITLEERLIYELKYFHAHNELTPPGAVHNLCMASQYFGGTTPWVGRAEDCGLVLGFSHDRGDGTQVVYCG